MDILLHICCGPCLIYPFSRLKDKKFKVKGFYYNPNIYPFEEYNKRKEALGILKEYLGFELESPEYVPADYSQAIINRENSTQRCAICWRLRLKATARYAKDNGFKIFSTTLLVSPYQDHELLKACAGEIASEEGLDFYYEDFRIGFKQAQIEARARGIYRQKYCGCKFSMHSGPAFVKQEQMRKI